MSQRNLSIRGSEEVDNEFLRRFRKLGDYCTERLVIKKNTDKILEKIIKRIGQTTRADLAIVTATNENYMSPKGTITQEVTFYQKRYHFYE